MSSSPTYKMQSSCAERQLKPCQATEHFAVSNDSLQHSRRAKAAASMSIRSNKKWAECIYYLIYNDSVINGKKKKIFLCVLVMKGNTSSELKIVSTKKITRR